MTAFTESVVEEAALAWLEGTGWQVAHGPDIAPDMAAAERADYGEVVLARRLRDALPRLNLALLAESLRRRANQIPLHRSAKAQEAAA
jgi:type I restriction enzyme R subunit